MQVPLLFQIYFNFLLKLNFPIEKLFLLPAGFELRTLLLVSDADTLTNWATAHSKSLDLDTCLSSASFLNPSDHVWLVYFYLLIVLRGSTLKYETCLRVPCQARLSPIIPTFMLNLVKNMKFWSIETLESRSIRPFRGASYVTSHRFYQPGGHPVDLWALLLWRRAVGWTGGTTTCQKLSHFGCFSGWHFHRMAVA